MEGQWPGSDLQALKKVISENFKNSKLRADSKTAIFSQNDPYVPLTLMDLFSDDWELITLEGKNHFQDSSFLEILKYL